MSARRYTVQPRRPDTIRVQPMDSASSVAAEEHVAVPTHLKLDSPTISIKRRRASDMIPKQNNRSNMPNDVKWYIIDPKHKALRRWDLFVLFLLLYTSIVTPVEVAFGETSLDVMFAVNRLIDVAFLVDLVLNFITARFKESTGCWVYNVRDIGSLYLRTWFWIDLVSVLPFDVIGVLVNNDSVSQLRILRIVRLMRLMKLVRILKASRILARWEHRIGVSYAVLSLLRFVVSVTIAAHWMACAWRITVEIENKVDEFGEPYNWTTEYGVKGSWGELYLASLYWSVMTITTIGYGDVIPVTTGERLVATLCMMCGASMYAYVVGAVCGIVGQMDEATSRFHSHMDQLNEYMSEFKLPQQMRETLRSYFLYCRALTRERQYQSLLKDMSPELRGEVTLFCYSSYIKTVPFFNADLRGLTGYLRRKAVEEAHHFITQVALLIIPRAFPPNELIVKVNEPAQAMYMVKRGIVAMHGQILGQRQHFGEDMLLDNYVRPYVVRSLTFLSCYMLRRSDLMQLFDHGQFPLIATAVRKHKIRLLFRNKFVGYAMAFKAFEATKGQHSKKKGGAGAGAGAGGGVSIHASMSRRVSTSSRLTAIRERTLSSEPTASMNRVEQTLASLNLPQVTASDSEGEDSPTARLPEDKMKSHSYARMMLDAENGPKNPWKTSDDVGGEASLLLRDMSNRMDRIEQALAKVVEVIAPKQLPRSQSRAGGLSARQSFVAPSTPGSKVSIAKFALPGSM